MSNDAPFNSALQPPEPSSHVAVIGAGTAGRHFALAAAMAGFKVTLEDVMPSNLRRAEAEFGSLGKQVRLVLTVEDAVEDADLAIDFVPDELESKLEIFSLLDRMAPPRTILLTPSETLSITDLASCTYRPKLCVMVRGLAPGQGGVRVLRARLDDGQSTTDETCDLAAGILEGIGYAVSIEPDPDLPQLMKNMNLLAGQRFSG